jgi:hypothetical protein
MAKKSSQFLREFISDEKRNYKIQIGSTIASSLAGVVCGAVLASIIWYAALKYFLNIV